MSDLHGIYPAGIVSKLTSSVLQDYSFALFGQWKVGSC